MGGSNDSAQRQAQAQERQKQAQIAATTQRVNALFDSPDRQKQIADFGAAMQDFYLQDANRQKGTADRDLKFALARSGLTGGSGARDANKTLGEDYQRGVLEAERKAQSQVAGLRGQDEQSRLNLTSLAQSGLNVGAAATQAAAAMRASLEGANATGRVQSLGDLFAGVATAKKRSEEMKGTRRADQLYASSYTPFYSLGGP